jgi:hypothetical protein
MIEVRLLSLTRGIHQDCSRLKDMAGELHTLSGGRDGNSFSMKTKKL